MQVDASCSHVTMHYCSRRLEAAATRIAGLEDNVQKLTQQLRAKDTAHATSKFQIGLECKMLLKEVARLTQKKEAAEKQAASLYEQLLKLECSLAEKHAAVGQVDRLSKQLAAAERDHAEAKARIASLEAEISSPKGVLTLLGEESVEESVEESGVEEDKAVQIYQQPYEPYTYEQMIMKWQKPAIVTDSLAVVLPEANPLVEAMLYQFTSATSTSVSSRIVSSPLSPHCDVDESSARLVACGGAVEAGYGMSDQLAIGCSVLGLSCAEGELREQLIALYTLGSDISIEEQSTASPSLQSALRPLAQSDGGAGSQSAAEQMVPRTLAQSDGGCIDSVLPAKVSKEEAREVKGVRVRRATADAECDKLIQRLKQLGAVPVSKRSVTASSRGKPSTEKDLAYESKKHCELLNSQLTAMLLGFKRD